jgi:NTE family protein
MDTIKNLAFKGGGILGIAYAGAIKVLEDNKMLAPIEKVAGTSAGAITATLVALEYNAKEIYNIVNSTDFKTFEENHKTHKLGVLNKVKEAENLIENYGLYDGDAFLNWMRKQITGKGLPETATFKDFKNAGMKDLHVFATDLNTQGLREFSFQATPDVVVAEACRASMSIPLFFEAWSFTNNIPNDHIYVDGGMIYNFPITTFDNTGGANPDTMGFFLSNLTGTKPVNDLKRGHLAKYVKITFETIMEAQNINFENNESQKRRTVVIDNLGISATNFGITAAQKMELYNSGIKYTTAFLKEKNVVALN